VKKIGILDAYIKLETKLFHFTWKYIYIYKADHRKNQEKDEFESLGMSP